MQRQDRRERRMTAVVSADG